MSNTFRDDGSSPSYPQLILTNTIIMIKINMTKIEKISKPKRRAFYKFCIEHYSNPENKFQGICSLFYNYFLPVSYPDIEVELPELAPYKPKKYFYTDYNYRCVDNSQFWFKFGDSKRRVKILKQILTKM